LESRLTEGPTSLPDAASGGTGDDVEGKNDLMSSVRKKSKVVFITPEAKSELDGRSLADKPTMPALSPVTRNTLQEQAYLKLRQALMSGQFAPGQSITLRAAAVALGTSVMPVRDALRRLEIEHALVPRGNRTLGVPEMTYASLTELREIRMVLEGLAAEKAARFITPPEFSLLDTVYQALATAASAGNCAEYMRANWSFHSTIYRASRSELLVAVIEPFWMRIGPYVRFMLPDRKSMVASLGNHSAAVEALRRGDGPAAGKAIQRDLSESAEGLAAMLRAREDVVSGKGMGASRRRTTHRGQEGELKTG